jgi:hypothetical protein
MDMYSLRSGRWTYRTEAAAPSSKPSKRRVRPTKASLLRGWYTGTYAEIANIKRGHMGGFEDVTAEFAPEFCGLNDLAEELRNVLFRSQDLVPFTGAYEDRNIMCDEMISVFSKAISYLERESEVNA